MPEGLKIFVGADISEAQAALKDIVSDAKSAGTDIKQGLGKALDKLSHDGVLSIGAIEDALKQFKQILSVSTDPEDIKKLNVAITSLKSRLSDLNSGSAVQGFEKVQIGSLRASNAALNLTHTLGLIPAESSHITHGIESILFSFENLRAQSGSTSQALSGLAGTIGTGLAIGLAITLISKLVEEFLSADDALIAITKDFENVKDSIDGMNDALESLGGDLDFIKEFRKLVAEIAGTKGAALELLSLDQQKKNDKILKDLIIDDLNDIESKISISLQNIRTLTKSQGILLTFDSKGLVDKSIVDDAGAVTKKYLEIFNSLVTEKNKLNDKLVKTNQDSALTDLKTTVTSNTLLDEARKKALADFDKFVNATIAKAKEVAGFLKGSFFVINYKFSPLDSKETSFKKAQAFLNDVSMGNLKLRVNFELSGMEPPPHKDIQKFIDPIDKAFKEFQQGTGLSTPQLGDIGGVSLSQVELLNEYNDILKDIGVNLFLIKGIDFGTATKKELDKIVDGAIKAAGVTEILKAAIISISTDALSELAAGIGEALAGGDISKGVKGFLTAIAGGIQSLGKQLLGFAIAQKIALKAMGTFNPIVTAAAGFALIAIGALMRKAVTAGIGSFAEGGLVFGPQLGLVGEGIGTTRSNPEVIAPLDKLRAMLSDIGTAGKQVVVMRTQVRGNNLALVQARTSRKNNRLGARQ